VTHARLAAQELAVPSVNLWTLLPSSRVRFTDCERKSSPFVRQLCNGPFTSHTHTYKEYAEREKQAHSTQRNTAPQASSAHSLLSFSRVSPSSATSLPAGASRVERQPFTRVFRHNRLMHPHSGDARGIEQVCIGIAVFRRRPPQLYRYIRGRAHIRRSEGLRVQASEHSPARHAVQFIREAGVGRRGLLPSGRPPPGLDTRAYTTPFHCYAHATACAATDCVAAHLEPERKARYPIRTRSMHTTEMTRGQL
jgi:hypothetical protein